MEDPLINGDKYKNNNGSNDKALRYGILIGLLFVGNNLIMYAVQPLPAKLVIIWIVGGIIEAAIAGLILAAIYRPANR